MQNFAGESFVPDVQVNKKQELRKLRGLYEHDVNSLEYANAYEAAKDLRRQVYNQALVLFKSSSKILQQLHIDDEDDNNSKNTSLALFSSKFAADPLSSLLIIKRFLENRADILVSSSEKSQIPILLSFVENLITQELEKN